MPIEACFSLVSAVQEVLLLHINMQFYEFANGRASDDLQIGLKLRTEADPLWLTVSCRGRAIEAIEGIISICPGKKRPSFGKMTK